MQAGVRPNKTRYSKSWWTRARTTTTITTHSPLDSHHGLGSFRLRRLAICTVLWRQGRRRGHYRGCVCTSTHSKSTHIMALSRHHIHCRVRLNGELSCYWRQGWSRRSLRTERVGQSLLSSPIYSRLMCLIIPFLAPLLSPSSSLLPFPFALLPPIDGHPIEKRLRIQVLY